MDTHIGVGRGGAGGRGGMDTHIGVGRDRAGGGQ